MLRVISSLETDFDKITVLSGNDVIHRYDIFDQAYVDRILKKGTPGYLINDHFVSGEFDGVNFVGLPLWLERQASKFNIAEFDNDITTNTCFNFMINKKQINRYLCIKLVELFGLCDFAYTWSAVDQCFDCSTIISELNGLGDNSPLSTEARTFILSPIRLEKRFIDPPSDAGAVFNNVCVAGYGSNTWTWHNGLGKMFSESAISLITESVWTQRAAIFTEKTLYSALGLTFPIWIGGYKQAQEWSRLGFDTFDDVIDHSYQNYDTLIERCYYAVANNLNLLRDRDRVTQLRLECKSRLLENRNLLLNNHLGKFVDQEISKLPQELQAVMPSILKHFRGQNR